MSSVPERITITGLLLRPCVYGENRYQVPAAVYRYEANSDPLDVSWFKPVAGEDPSFVNNTDLSRLLITITHIAAGFRVNFDRVPYIAVGVKHGNACGVGISFTSAVEALRKMVEGHPEALFGGCVVLNFRVTAELAEVLLHHRFDAAKRGLDFIIAPGFDADGVAALERKHKKCRMFENETLAWLTEHSLDKSLIIRPLRGGFQIQPNYTFILNLEDPRIEKRGWMKELDEGERQDMILAWAIGSTSNSNTITLVRHGQLLGNGVAQVSRKLACKAAIMVAEDAGHAVVEAVAYSDSFFPFRDGPDVLVRAGVRSIFTSSGSIRDAEVFAAFAEGKVVVRSLPDAVCRGFCIHG